MNKQYGFGQWFVMVAAFLVATLLSALASAQTPVEFQNAEVQLYAPLRFVQVYAAFVEGIHPNVFDSCARYGARCPNETRLFSSWQDAPQRLRDFPILEATHLNDTPSPAIVAEALLDRGVLSARCLRPVTGTAGNLHFAWRKVLLTPSIMSRNSWRPHRWFPRDCTQVALTVRGGTAFVYPMRLTPSMQAFKEATALLGQPPADEAQLHQAAVRVENALQDVDWGTAQAALAFTRVFLSQFLSVAQTQQVVPRDRVAHVTTTVVPPESNTRLQIFAIMSAIIASVFITFFILSQMALRRMREGFQADSEAAEVWRMAELARAEEAAFERGKARGQEEAEDGFKHVRATAFALAERLLSLLPEEEVGRTAHHTEHGVDIFLALQNAQAYFSAIFQMAHDQAVKREREARKLADERLKTSLVEDLRNLGLEVSNPNADIVTLVTTTFEKWRSSRTHAAAVTVQATLDIATPKPVAKPPPPPPEATRPSLPRQAMMGLADLAMTILKEEDPEGAKRANPQNPKLAELATAALYRLLERYTIRHRRLQQGTAQRLSVWSEWADAHLDYTLTLASKALGTPGADEETWPPDLSEKADRLYALLAKMGDRRKEYDELNALVESLLPEDSLFKGFDYPVAAKLGSFVQHLQMSGAAAIPRPSTFPPTAKAATN